jgi:hypothetical protein
MALVAAATGQHRRAARLFGAADALRTRLGAPLQPNDREFNTRYSDRSRNALGESAFTDAWNAGANLALDDVLTYALQDERTVAARE